MAGAADLAGAFGGSGSYDFGDNQSTGPITATAGTTRTRSSNTSYRGGQDNSTMVLLGLAAVIVFMMVKR